MRTKFKRILAVLVVLLVIGVFPVYASEEYYTYEIFDDAGVMSSDSDYEDLKIACSELSRHVNVAVDTIDHTSDTESACYELGRELFGSDPAVVFIINMKNHEIWLRGINGAEKTITAGRCRSITDNVYKEATNQNFAKCARLAIESCTSLYMGGKIAQPMKFVVNIFVSLMIGLVTVYIMIVSSRRKRKASVEELLRGSVNNMQLRIVNSVCYATERIRHSSSSSSGGGGGHSGGGGGGGGHSF